MRPINLLVLALSAGGTVAYAAPRDTFTFAGVPSVAAVGDAANATLTGTVTDTYTTNFLTVSGTLSNRFGASWAYEASILVTPPGGAAPFVVSPFRGTTFTAPLASAPGAYAIPVAPISSQGAWSFQFFEMFDDQTSNPGTFTEARDTTWSTVSITLDDGAAPTGPAVGSGPSATFTGVVSGDGPQTRTWNAPSATGFVALRLSGQVTALTGFEADPNDVVGGQTTQAAVRITPPGGGAPVLVFPVPEDSASTVEFAFNTTLPVAQGTYTFEFIESDGTVANTLGDQAGADNVWNRFTAEFVTVPEPAPIVADLGIVQGGVGGAEALITRTLSGLTGVSWLKLRLNQDVSDATGFYLDIDTNGTTTTAGVSADTEIGLYAVNGAGIDVDDDNGWDNQSQLTFGDTDPIRPNPVPPAGVDPEEFDRDGFNGPLVAGTYYLAIARFNTAFGVADFNVTTTSTAASNYIVNIRTNLPQVLTGCGPSDVAGAGQVIGSDNQLTADDIIVFIGWFFVADTRADVAGSGQTAGADGQFTADDIILFINRFFAGC
jgi:hypothetical protein